MNVYELGRSCLEIGVGIIGSSVAAVIVRENARDGNWWLTNSKTAKSVLFYSSLIFGICILLFILAATRSWMHTIVVGLFCSTIYFQSSSELYEAFYRSKDRVSFPALIGMICNLSIALCTLLCVYYFPNPVLWAAGGIFVRWFVQSTILAKNTHYQSPYALQKHASQFRNFSALLLEITPIGIGSIAFILYARLDVLMLQWMGFENSIAIYGCAFRPIGFFVMLASAFYLAFAPSISKMIHSNPRRALLICSKVSGCFLLLGAIACLGIILFRHEITRLLYPSQFEIAAEGLYALSWTLPIIFSGNAAGFFLINQGKKGAICYMTVNVIGVIVNVIGNYFMIPLYDFVGAAWTTVFTDGFTTLLLFLFSTAIAMNWFQK